MPQPTVWRDHRDSFHHRQLTAVARLEVIRMYEANIRVQTIARVIGCSMTTVVGVAHEAGIRRFVSNRKLSEEQQAEAIAMWGRGHSPAEIGRKFEVSGETIRRILRDATGRKQGERLKRRKGWRCPHCGKTPADKQAESAEVAA